MNRGARLTELLKQPQYSPLTIAEQVIVIYAGTKGYLDAIEVGRVQSFESGLLKHLRNHCQDLLEDLTKNDRKVEGSLEESIKTEIEKFSANF